MKPSRRPSTVRGALDLIEEAVHVLRRAPVSTLATYFVGSLPFVGAMLYFWAEMSQSPFAYRHLAGESLALAILFVWMKVWQARFACALWIQVAGHDERDAATRSSAILILSQTAWQTLGLVVLPLSLILTVPFGWVYAFCQNLVVMAGFGRSGAKELFKRALKHALLWPRQNHAILSVLFAFALFVFLNWIIVSLSIPALAKTLFGIETIFSRSPFAMLNSTFLVTMLALTYLSVDPLVKAVYTLRCFYGEARASGADIKAELKQLAQITPVLMAVLIFMFGTRTALSAESQPVQSSTASMSSADLDQQITETLKHPKYAWRFPRQEIDAAAESKSGVITQFFERIRQWLSSIFDWIRKLFRSRSAPSRNSLPGSTSLVHVYTFALIAAVAATGALLLYRVLQNRNGKRPGIVSSPIPSAPDLSGDDLGAEQLPEDGWTALGRDLLQRGEWRLAMRAFYLASLAHLAGRNLVSLARFKSNRDYARELDRRAQAFPELPRLFRDNVSVFDRVWYGRDQIDTDMMNQFVARVETIKCK